MEYGANNRLNLLIISTPNPTKKAGIIAYDLLKLFRDKRYNVNLLVRYWSRYPDADILAAETILQALVRFVRLKFFSVLRILFSVSYNYNTDRNYYFSDYDQTRSYFSRNNRILKKLDKSYDAIIVLFYYDFMNFKDIYELYMINNKPPILLYMMDMAPLTGGCHYAWDCVGYTKKCGFCPALYSNKENDQSRINFEFNKNFIDKINIIPIAGSALQYTQLLRSTLFKQKNKCKVLLGIDENLFKPGDKLLARKKLNLPQDKIILFYGAVYLEEKRKGIKYFLEALELLEEKIDSNKFKYMHIVIAGSSINKLEKDIDIPITFLDHLSIDMLPFVFQASDMFISTSIEDSGPMMINQSIMSGTPVVSFDTGIAIDLVETGVTGYKAELKNSADLAEGIKYLLKLEKGELSKICQNCRNLGLREFNQTRQLNHLINIIKNESEN